MDEPVLVRKLTPSERAQIRAAKSGDTLSDGSILLRHRDMDRMGLERLRTWLQTEVIGTGSTLAVDDEIPEPHAVLTLEE